MRFSTALLAQGLLASAATAINIIDIKANKFFDTVTGKQFFLKGKLAREGGSSPPASTSWPLSRFSELN